MIQEHFGDDLVPLQSFEAEMSVLGSMLLSDDAACDCEGSLKAEEFYSPAHAEIFRAMGTLLRSSQAIDYLTLKNSLETRGTLGDVGGTDYLLQLAEIVPTYTNALFYAEIVREKARLRAFESIGRAMVGDARKPGEEGGVDARVKAAEQRLAELGSAASKKLVHAREVAKELFVAVDHLLETNEPSVGMMSGFIDLDDMTTGFYPGDLIVVGARPSMGKTSFAMKIAMEIASRRAGAVAVFSIEMSKLQIMRRMAAMMAKVSTTVLQRSNLSMEAYQGLADACSKIYDIPLYLDDSSEISAPEMRSMCRALPANEGLAAVVVDYLQIMRSSRAKPENRVQEISQIARDLKALAKDLGVPVIALSQLGRQVEQRENKRPMLSDLRDSGSIEAEADMVMFLYRDEYYKQKESTQEQAYWDPNRTEEAEVIVAKHRNGPTGVVRLGFQPTYTRFVNLAEGRY